MRPAGPYPHAAASTWHRWAIVAVLVGGAAARFQNLSGQSFWLDELHSLEFACGHGVDHQSIPTGRLLADPPDLTHLATARPAWAVWTGMARVSHPPVPYLLLRLWADVFGESEAAVRSLSGVCSMAAVVGLFLAVRVWGGTTIATGAAGLMAFAGPQVHAAREVKPYALLMALATAALWAVGRTARDGPSHRRTAGLSAVLLAMLMTHYFAVAAVAAVGVYAVVATAGPTRRHLAGAVAAAGLTFAVVWGPFMVRQASTFSTADRSAAFLAEAGPGHAAFTLRRLAALPVSLLADRQPVPAGYVAAGLLLYAAGLALTAGRRWPGVWPLWFAATAALLGGLDLARSTRHLQFVRYPLVAAPAVCAAVAVLPTLRLPAVLRVAARSVAAGAAAFVLWSLPSANLPANFDFRAMAADVTASVPAGEPLVFAGPPEEFGAQILYLAVSHYAGPLTRPVMLLDAPATPAAVAALGRRPVVYMVVHPSLAFEPSWLPGYHVTVGQLVPHVGVLMRMARDDGRP